VKKAEFDRKFAERFGPHAKPGANSYFIYDGLTIVHQALQSCASEDVECVNRYFRSLKEFDGVAGKVSFQPDGSNLRPYGIKAVRRGAFTWLSPATNTD
jgi:ABC-type branched-subunit amino acid transport system substrate-binding protein